MVILDSYKWNTSPTAYISVNYDYMRDGTSVKYRFNWRVWLGYSSSYYYNALQIMFDLNNGATIAKFVVKNRNTNESGWDYSGSSGWIEVKNPPTALVNCNISLIDTNAEAQKFKTSAKLSVPSMYSTLEAFNVEIDSAFRVSIAKHDATLVDTLTISHEGTTIKKIEGIQDGDYVTFTQEEREVIYNRLWNKSSSYFTLLLRSTAGEDVRNVSVSIKNAQPEFDSSVFDVYDKDEGVIAITKDKYTLVQNISLLAVNIPQASGMKGAIISKYTVEIGNVVKEYAPSQIGNGVEYGTTISSGQQNITLTAIDSRGNSTSAVITRDIIAYYAPQITAKLNRRNNYEKETHFKVNVNFPNIKNTNSVDILYSYGLVNGEQNEKTPIENGVEYILECDQRYAFTFVVCATDLFGSYAEKTFQLAKGKLPLFVDTEKNAVGINAFPLENEALRVGEGIAVYEDGIVIASSTADSTKMFKIIVDDNGVLSATEYKP